MHLRTYIPDILFEVKMKKKKKKKLMELNEMREIERE